MERREINNEAKRNKWWKEEKQIMKQRETNDGKKTNKWWREEKQMMERGQKITLMASENMFERERMSRREK